MSLIALGFGDVGGWLLIALEVAIGLGMVIFVHELGHFLVAKACGVKCEKFYLGFDVYGLKLLHWRWGETEYGVGLIPLGGYVKMLGQDDNPSKAAEERERSTVGDAGSGALDPRSYMAQSVPKRMAIISAGVIMNVLFAFVLSTIAYGIGVREIPCVVGSVLTGEAAWRAGLRTGDRVLEVGGLANPRFRDLQQGVVLGSKRGQGVKFVIARPGMEKPFDLSIVPDHTRGAPSIGVVSPLSNVLGEKPLTPNWDPDFASHLHEGDKVVAIGDEHVDSYSAIKQALTLMPNKTLDVTIVRPDKDESSRKLHVRVPPRPIKTLGMIMKMGAISAVQDDSPAQKAGVKVGDRLVEVLGKPIHDPMEVPGLVAALAGKEVKLKLLRDNKPVELSMTVRNHFDYEHTLVEGDPLSVPGLGLAYHVSDTVASVDPKLGGNAKIMGEKDGTPDTIIAATFLPPQAAIDAKQARQFNLNMAEKDCWPTFWYLLQDTVPDTKVELKLERDGKQRTVTLEPEQAPGWFNPDRGFGFQSESYVRTAQSVGDDLALAARETKESVTQVYGFLNKLFTGEVSARNLGGPGMIAAVAGAYASVGISSLLIFLAMLSANLAVLNFLPIPLLDGGHMAFLIIEAIRGKPVSERIVMAFHYAGFVFIIGLMLFVLSLDLQRGWNWLHS